MLTLLLSTLALAGGEAPPLVGAEPTDGTYPAALAIGVRGRGISCTGSLLTPRIVLTAAHCTVRVTEERFLQLGQVHFGDDVSASTDTMDFESLHIHPDFYEPPGGGMGMRNDIALIVLDEAATVEPVWFRSAALTDADIGLDLTIVGIGATAAGVAPDYIKRSAAAVLDRYDDQYLITEAAGNATGATICSGDSGGPAYAMEDDALVQVGVISWGDLSCAGKAGSTRTDVHTDFILDIVEAVHGTRDECAVFDRYDDGVCDETCPEVDPDCVVDNEDPEGAGCGCASAGGPGGLVLLAIWLPFVLMARSFRVARGRGESRPG